MRLGEKEKSVEARLAELKEWFDEPPVLPDTESVEVYNECCAASTSSAGQELQQPATCQRAMLIASGRSRTRRRSMMRPTTFRAEPDLRRLERFRRRATSRRKRAIRDFIFISHCANFNALQLEDDWPDIPVSKPSFEGRPALYFSLRERLAETLIALSVLEIRLAAEEIAAAWKMRRSQKRQYKKTAKGIRGGCRRSQSRNPDLLRSGRSYVRLPAWRRAFREGLSARGARGACRGL
jgi:hypothetical protein